MNILWICNTMTVEGSAAFHLKVSPFGGWMSSLASRLAQTENINLSILFNHKTDDSRVRQAMGEHIRYYMFPFEENTKENIDKVLGEAKPDVIHFHGVEFKANNALIDYLDKDITVASIQGLKSAYSVCYDIGVDFRKMRTVPLSYIGIKKGSILSGKKRMEKDAKYEEELLKKLKYVMGRTSYDEAVTKQINPELRYFKVGEMLRQSFYDDQKWDIQKIKRHSVFVSNIGYSIKGGHHLIKAVKILVKAYPDICVNISGPKMEAGKTFKDRMKYSAYAMYIDQLIKEAGLSDNIHFVGVIDEKKIKEHLLNCHVFVLPSNAENSPNSLGEAMICGVPCVASCCGGVPDLLLHKEEGFLYSSYEYYMLAYWISQIFDHDDTACRIGKKAMIHAMDSYDKELNLASLLEVYGSISK